MVDRNSGGVTLTRFRLINVWLLYVLNDLLADYGREFLILI